MVGGEAGVTGGAESQKLDFIFWVDEALLMETTVGATW